MQVPCFRLTFLRWALWWWGYSEPPFCPFPDVRLRHQGALGNWLSGEGRKSLLILSASSPSEYLPAMLLHQHQLGDCSLLFLLIQHWQKQPRLTLWDTSTSRCALLQSVGVWRLSSPGGPSSNPLRLIMPLSFLGSASGWSLLSRLLPLWYLNIHFLHLQLIPFIQFLVMNSWDGSRVHFQLLSEGSWRLLFSH